MKFLHPYYNLRDIELCLILTEAFYFSKQLVEFTSLDERHYEIQPKLSLEKVVNAAKKWMICFEK